MVMESEVHSFLRLHCCRANVSWPMEYVRRGVHGSKKGIAEATKHRALEEYSVNSEPVKDIGGTCVSLESKFWTIRAEMITDLLSRRLVLSLSPHILNVF